MRGSRERPTCASISSLQLNCLMKLLVLYIFFLFWFWGYFQFSVWQMIPQPFLLNPATMPAATLSYVTHANKGKRKKEKAWKIECRKWGLWGVEESGFNLKLRKLQELSIFWQTYYRIQKRTWVRKGLYTLNVWLHSI